LVGLGAGEALFDVAKDPDRPFIVQVGDRQIRALGTSFVVRREKDQLAVTLVEGKVAVTQGPLELSGPLAQSRRSVALSSQPKSIARTATPQQEPSGSAEVFTLTPGQRLVIPENRPVQNEPL
jgi:ferric-dicitrate binding protein FerR (iron transport regulator)